MEARRRACHAEASAVVDAGEGGRDGRVVDGGGLENRYMLIGFSLHAAAIPAIGTYGVRLACYRRSACNHPLQHPIENVSPPRDEHQGAALIVRT
jgi:hypothetical protein